MKNFLFSLFLIATSTSFAGGEFSDTPKLSEYDKGLICLNKDPRCGNFKVITHLDHDENSRLLEVWYDGYMITLGKDTRVSCMGLVTKFYQEGKGWESTLRGTEKNCSLLQDSEDNISDSVSYAWDDPSK